jgi:alpha-beta hydrolase superfamily lysophospholipase
LAQLLARVWPSYTSASGLDNNAISRDPAMAQTYGNDPLNHNRISVRLFTQINNAGQWALDHAHEISLPLLLAHGSADRITSHEASRQFAARVPGDCTFKLWDGLYHETHNEPEQDEVIGFMVEWLRRHI